MSTTSTFTVVGMTCGHCVRSVKDEVGKIDGVTSVTVDLRSGDVTVESDTDVAEETFVAVDDDAVRKAVEAAGYTVTT